MFGAPESPLIFRIGKHTIHIQDRILHVLFSGRVTTTDAVSIRQTVLNAGDRLGLMGALVNLDGLADFDTGARAHFARAERPYPYYAVAFYGGSFGARMLVTTVLRAGRLIAPEKFPFEFELFKTEQEARAHLLEARPQAPQDPGASGLHNKL
jgi:hypothetical protein